MYNLKYLPSADLDMIEAEEYLYNHSPPAADKLADAIKKQASNLLDYPLMYPVYEKRPYFRVMPLPFDYLCLYHVDEGSKMVEIHRILRGFRDIVNII